MSPGWPGFLTTLRLEGESGVLTPLITAYTPHTSCAERSNSSDVSAQEEVESKESVVAARLKPHPPSELVRSSV